MSNSVTAWIATCQTFLSFTISWNLLKVMSFESVMLSNHLILCHHLSCPQSYQTSGSFLMNWFFPLCGQSIGDSASTTVLPMNIWGWFPLGLTSLISLLSKRISRVFSSTTIWKHQFFSAQSSSWSNFHIRVSLSQSFPQIKHSLKSKGPLYSLYICQIQMWHTWNLYKAIY